jgi:hypothetical protein
VEMHARVYDVLLDECRAGRAHRTEHGLTSDESE